MYLLRIVVLILDVAVTGVDLGTRADDNDPYKVLDVRYKQKLNKYLSRR